VGLHSYLSVPSFKTAILFVNSVDRNGNGIRPILKLEHADCIGSKIKESNHMPHSSYTVLPIVSFYCHERFYLCLCSPNGDFFFNDDVMFAS
jgi:hypothetical protein